jgi:hypothetical protein
VASQLSTRIANPLNDRDWDAKIAVLPGATFFHSAAWARVLHETYNFLPTYVTTGEGNDVESVLPLMSVDSWLTGRRGVALPFTDACAPLCRDQERFAQLWTAALKQASARKWRYVEIRGGKQWLKGIDPSLSFWAHVLDLRSPPETLFAGFNSSVRRAVRKAEQSDLTVDVTRSTAAVQEFYSLFCLTRKRLGVPTQSMAFFSAIYRNIISAQKGCVVLVRKNTVPIAGAMFFHFGKSAVYKFAASDSRFQNFRPSNLVIWRAIQWHVDHKFEEIDFGRTSLSNEGLRQFKSSWGTKEHTIDYIRYNRVQNRFARQKDQSASWHNVIFKALPVTFSRLVGLALYKHTA